MGAGSGAGRSATATFCPRVPRIVWAFKRRSAQVHKGKNGGGRQVKAVRKLQEGRLEEIAQCSELWKAETVEGAMLEGFPTYGFRGATQLSRTIMYHGRPGIDAEKD